MFEAVDDFVIVFDLVLESGEFFVVFAEEAFERLDAPTELLELTGECEDHGMVIECGVHGSVDLRGLVLGIGGSGPQANGG